MDGSLLFVCVNCGKGLSDYDEFVAHTERHERGLQDMGSLPENASDFSPANSGLPESNALQNRETYCKIEADDEFKSSAEPKTFNIRDIEQTCNAILELAASRKVQDAVKGDFITKKERQTLQEASKLILLNKLYKEEKTDVTRKRKASPIGFQSNLERQSSEISSAKFFASSSHSNKAEATIHYRATPPVHRSDASISHGIPVAAESSAQNIDQAVHDVMAASGLPSLQYLPSTRHSPEVPTRWSHMPVSPSAFRFFPQRNCPPWTNWYLSRPHVRGHNPNFTPTIQPGFVHYSPMNQHCPQLFRPPHLAAAVVPCSSPQDHKESIKSPLSQPSAPLPYSRNPFICISDVRSLSLSTDKNEEHCAKPIDIQVGLQTNLSELSGVTDSSDERAGVIQESTKDSVSNDLGRMEGKSTEVDEHSFARESRVESIPSEVMVEHTPAGIVPTPESASYISLQGMSFSTNSSFQSEWRKEETLVTTSCSHPYPEITSYFHVNADGEFDLDQSSRVSEFHNGANNESESPSISRNDSQELYSVQHAMTGDSEMIADTCESQTLVSEVPEVSSGDTQYFSEPIVANVYSLVPADSQTGPREPNEAFRIEGRVPRNAETDDCEAVMSYVQESETSIDFSSLHTQDTNTQIEVACRNTSSPQSSGALTPSSVSPTPSIVKVKVEVVDDEVATTTYCSTVSEPRGIPNLRPVTKKEPEEEIECVAEKQQFVEENCGAQTPCDFTEKPKVNDCNEGKENLQMASQVPKRVTESEGKLFVTVRLSEDAVKQEPNVSGQEDSLANQQKETDSLKVVSKAGPHSRYCLTDLSCEESVILKSPRISQSTPNKGLTLSRKRVVRFGPQKGKDGKIAPNQHPFVGSSLNSPDSAAEQSQFTKTITNQRLATVGTSEETKKGSQFLSPVGDSALSTNREILDHCEKEQNENEAGQNLTRMQHPAQTKYPADILEVVASKVSSATPGESGTSLQTLSRSPKRQAIDDRGVNRQNGLPLFRAKALVEAVSSLGKVEVSRSFEGNSGTSRMTVTHGQNVNVSVDEREPSKSLGEVNKSGPTGVPAHNREPRYPIRIHRFIDKESRKEESQLGTKTPNSTHSLSGFSSSVTVPCIPQPYVVTQVLPVHAANALNSIGKNPVGGSYLVGSNVAQAPVVVAYQGSYFLQVGDKVVPMGPTMYPMLLPKQSVVCTSDRKVPPGCQNLPLGSLFPEMVSLASQGGEPKQTKKVRKRSPESDDDYRPEPRDESVAEDGDKIVCRRCQSFFEDNSSWMAHAKECSRKKYNFRKRSGSYSKFYGSDQSSGDDERFE